MKKFITTLVAMQFLLLFYTENLFSQQDPQYTNYMYNTTVINPAYAGTREAISILGLYRAQWVGLEGAPVTSSVSIHSPLKESNFGLGLSVVVFWF